MFKPFSDRANLPDVEQQVLEYWASHRIFEQSVETRQGGPDFTFYEGPPTANGRPGIHHVFSRTVKDLVCRYRTMRGFQVHRKAGWDTHGLPVEIEVEKKLGLKSKEEIERFGIDRFNAECRRSVFEYKAEWEDLTRRMGYWVDMESPYVTCDNSYIESVWWALDQYFKAGLIYQDFKIQLYCPRCGTPLSSHEVSLGYRDVQDPSVYLKARLRESPDTSLLVWTTTPWTLISNVALAVNADVEYVKVRARNEFLILARERLAVLGSDPVEVIESIPGRDLVGKEYERWFSFFPTDTRGWYVIDGDFVTTTDGSGIVHMAPAYGEDDYAAAKRHSLPLIQALDARGRFLDLAGPFAGKFFKEADAEIVSDLKSRGLLFRKETYPHSYPHCWRCETPLLYFARKSWYIRTTAYADRMLENNRQIGWHPPEMGEGRFGNWLEENKDWAISRDRYWGTPIPIWVCGSCDQRKSIGSVAELLQLAGRLPEPMDLHKPYIDTITFPCECGQTMTRIPEVVDVWFDSGSMPFAQWHYPFENQETFRRSFPADYIAEGVDQTRGWFYTLHSISAFLFKVPAFKNVIVNELVLDKNGQKMSKSRGNTVNPFEVIGRYGADSVRWYLVVSSPPWKPKLFDVDDILEVQRKFFNTLLNTYSFFALYANVDGFQYGGDVIPTAQRSDMDRWILSLLHTTLAEYVAAMDDYDPTRAARTVNQFTVDQLSNWYVRRSRRRFWKSEAGHDKSSAYQTLFECLMAILKMTAPIAPFLADELYRRLGAEGQTPEQASVHLSRIPEPDPALRNESLEARMALAQNVVFLVRSMRSRTNLRVRQPLARIAVPASGEAKEWIEQMADVIQEEVNVKSIEFVDESSPLVRKAAAPNFRTLGPKFGKSVNLVAKRIREMTPLEVLELEKSGTFRTTVGESEVEIAIADVSVATQNIEGWIVESLDGLTVALDATLSPELIQEGIAREFVNRIQNLRKESGLEVSDRIRIFLSDPGAIGQAVRSMEGYVCNETLAEEIVSSGEPQSSADFEIDGQTISVGISKLDSN